MTDVSADDKIDRFRKLVELDPEDATSHFTLGTAYAEADRHAEAAESFLNAISINADFSKAFQLAGRSLIAISDTERATRVLTQGHAVASRQGDLMPKNAIEAMMKELGLDVPESQKPDNAAAAPAATGDFVCAKTGKPGTKMPRPPFKGPVGAWIHERISNETWQTWLGQGTKIINELRLDLSSDEGSDIYDFGMLLYVGLDAKTYRELTGNEPPQIGNDYEQMLLRVLNADPDQLAALQGNVREIVQGD